MASRIVRIFALVCIFGALAGIGWSTIKGMGELGVHTGIIDEQRAALERIDAELTSLDSMIVAEGEKIKEAETEDERVEIRARGMKVAMRIAKQQSVLDGDKMRAGKIIESREEKASVVRGRMLRWNLILGAAAFVLAGFWFGLKKLAAG